MNWGEYVHFTSGAAGADLHPSGRPRLRLAPGSGPISSSSVREQFPGVTY